MSTLNLDWFYPIDTPIHEFIVQSHDNRGCTVALSTIASSYDASFQFHLVGLLDCTASFDCNAHHYMMLITSNDGLVGKAYDASLWILNGANKFNGVNDTALADHPIVQVSTASHFSLRNGHVEVVEAAVAATIPSFQYNQSGYGFDYVAATYDVSISNPMYETGIVDPSTLTIHVPTTRRLIRAGEETMMVEMPESSLSFGQPAPWNNTILKDPFKVLSSVEPTDGSTAEPTDEPTSESTSELIATVDALNMEINRLRDEIVKQQNEIMLLKSRIDHAKQVIVQYTSENSGCDDGKRRWLEDVGLFEDDEIVEVIGGSWMIPATITLTIPVVVESTGYSAEEAADLAAEHGMFSDIACHLVDLVHRSDDVSGDVDYDYDIDYSEAHRA